MVGECGAALRRRRYAAYRVMSGVLSMQSVGSVTHALDFDTGDGGWHDCRFGGGAEDGDGEGAGQRCDAERGDGAERRMSTETFAGDGTTTVFTLSEAPFQADGGESEAADGQLQPGRDQRADVER